MLHHEGVWNARQYKLNQGEVAVETSQKCYKQYTAHKKMRIVIGLAQIMWY